jgi:hypothetical protein
MPAHADLSYLSDILTNIFIPCSCTFNPSPSHSCSIHYFLIHLLLFLIYFHFVSLVHFFLLVLIHLLFLAHHFFILVYCIFIYLIFIFFTSSLFILPPSSFTHSSLSTFSLHSYSPPCPWLLPSFPS